MATGKTNSRYVKIFVDDSGGTARDITCSVNQIGDIGLTYSEDDATAFCDGVENATLGIPSNTFDFGGPFNNTATTGAHGVLSGINGVETTSKTVTIQIGIRAAPTTGDPEWEGEYKVSRYTVNPGNMTWTAQVVPFDGTAGAWGTVA